MEHSEESDLDTELKDDDEVDLVNDNEEPPQVRLNQPPLNVHTLSPYTLYIRLVGNHHHLHILCIGCSIAAQRPLEHSDMQNAYATHACAAVIPSRYTAVPTIGAR